MKYVAFHYGSLKKEMIRVINIIMKDYENEYGKKPNMINVNKIELCLLKSYIKRVGKIKTIFGMKINKLDKTEGQVKVYFKKELGNLKNEMRK